MYEGGNPYCYDNVKNWAAKIKATGGNVFKLKYLLIPCNILNSHWCLCFADIAKKRIQYYDSKGGNGFHFMSGLQNYLKDEVGRDLFTWNVRVQFMYLVLTFVGDEARGGRFGCAPPRLGLVGAHPDGHGHDATAD
jgi:hypothetical protein